MTNFWVIIAGFIFANFLFLFILWNNFSNPNKNPKYLNSSYDINLKNEVNSVLLNYIGESIKKNFGKKVMANETPENTKKTGLDKINEILSRKNLTEKYRKLILRMLSRFRKSENFNKTIINSLKRQEDEKNRIRISENTKISMFLDKKRKSVLVLKVSNDGEVLNKYSYGDDQNGERNGAGEISLYSVQLKNFLNNKYFSKKESLIFKSNKEKFRFFIRKFLENANYSGYDNSLNNGAARISNCFTSKFLGRIIGVVSSNDKNRVAIAYEIKFRSSVTYRIRYFHNIQALCNAKDIQRQKYKKFENKIIDNFYKIEQIQEKKNSNVNKQDNDNYNKIYYEITELDSSNKDINETDNSVMNNFFSEEFFDDFSLGLSSPVKAMAIKKDILAFAADNQNFQYTILKRKRGSLVNKPSWFVFSQGPVIDRSVDKFFHTNSLKFLNEEILDGSNLIYNMIQITTTIKITTNNSSDENKFADVKTTGVIRKIKQINFSKFFENENKEINYLHEELRRKINKRKSVKFYESDLVKEAFDKYTKFKPEQKENLAYCGYNKESIFDVKNCFRNFRSSLRPTLFSNNNNRLQNKNLDSFVMEFNKGNLLLLEGSLDKGNLSLMDLNPGKENKVEKLYSDSQNNNVLIKYEDEENFAYIIREEVESRDKDQKPDQFIELKTDISMKNINFPKLFKDRKPLSFLFENINNKNIAIFIDERGILHSLDFTEFRNNLINRAKPFNLFKPETYINVNWDYLKYILILSIAYCVFFSNSILNNEESNSESSPSNTINGSNTESISSSRQTEINEALSQERKLKEDIALTGKKFLQKINELISTNNLEENSTLRTKIIEMIDSAEKSFINLRFVPSELLEEMESIKSKLFLEEKIEEKYLKLGDDFKKDFDEVSRISNTNSDISESTTNQSDSEDYLYNFEKNRGNFYLQNGMKVKRMIPREMCLNKRIKF